MENKFIVNNGRFIHGYVEYHKDLAIDRSTTKGGGLYYVDSDLKILVLYDESSDFGRATPEAIINAIEQTDLPEFSGYEVRLSKAYDLSIAIRLGVTIIEEIK